MGILVTSSSPLSPRMVSELECVFGWFGSGDAKGGLNVTPRRFDPMRRWSVFEGAGGKRIWVETGSARDKLQALRRLKQSNYPPLVLTELPSNHTPLYEFSCAIAGERRSVAVSAWPEDDHGGVVETVSMPTACAIDLVLVLSNDQSTATVHSVLLQHSGKVQGGKISFSPGESIIQLGDLMNLDEGTTIPARLCLGSLMLQPEVVAALRPGSELAFKMPERLEVLLQVGGEDWAFGELMVDPLIGGASVRINRLVSNGSSTA